MQTAVHDHWQIQGASGGHAPKRSMKMSVISCALNAVVISLSVARQPDKMHTISYLGNSEHCVSGSDGHYSHKMSKILGTRHVSWAHKFQSCFAAGAPPHNPLGELTLHSPGLLAGFQDFKGKGIRGKGKDERKGQEGVGDLGEGEKFREDKKGKGQGGRGGREGERERLPTKKRARSVSVGDHP